MLALVTGASSGIGEAFAARLAADGWDLLIVARRADRLRALAERLAAAHGVSVQPHGADLTDPADLAGLEGLIVGTEPDMLVNNAGFAGYREFAGAEPALISDLIGVHVLAPARLTRAAVPAMVRRGSGSLITIASLLAFTGSLPPVPLPHRAIYAAAKAFQVTFTQALAGELAGTGVRVQVCCPGLVDTEFHQVAGMAPSRPRFPVLLPDQVAAAALAGLSLGEVLCVPGMANPALLDDVTGAQVRLFRTAVGSGLADRYQQD